MNSLNCHKRLDRGMRHLVVAIGLASAVSAGHAQILGTTARQASSGSLKFLAYYQGAQDQTLRFTVNDSGTCSASNGVAFSCGQAGDIDAKGSGGAAAMKILWQPWERFQYYGMFSAGDYSVRVPSATITNLLTGDTRGLTYGVGIKASVVPDTIVAVDGLPTPAIALDLSIARSLYDFNRRSPGGTPGASNSINQRLELMTYQFAVESSHMFVVDEHVKLEPYGGMKWTRVQTDLKDLVDGSHAGGQKDSVSPFFGFRVATGEHEALFAEASFVDGYHYGAGLELRFK